MGTGRVWLVVILAHVLTPVTAKRYALRSSLDWEIGTDSISSLDGAEFAKNHSSIVRCVNPSYSIYELSAGDLGFEAVENSGDSASAGSKKKRVVDDYLGVLFVLKNCPFSAEFEALVTAVASAYPQVKFVKADATQFTDITSFYGISSFPKLLVFRDGQLGDRFRGGRKMKHVVDYVSNITGAPPASPLDRRAPRYPVKREVLPAQLLNVALAYAVFRGAFSLYKCTIDDSYRARLYKNLNRSLGLAVPMFVIFAAFRVWY